ncbi:hypothetical protein BRAO375_1270007 [Bradyrhizobium sp. ORS 375]|nr:hypothetical protein BRAO375_1270007 [Bradyrhizobium sp. ORS 375]
MPPEDVVMQCTALAEGDFGQIALRRFGGLFNRLRHLSRLTVAEPYTTLLIADHDKSCEAEPLPSLHHFCDAIDVYEFVDEFRVALVSFLTGKAVGGRGRGRPNPVLRGRFNLFNGGRLAHRRKRKASFDMVEDQIRLFF